MHIIGIVGSKRKKGNTATLVQKTLEPFLEPFRDRPDFSVETIYLGDLKIEGCRGCEGCAKTNQCIIDDDMQGLYAELRKADALIVGSPTYFYNITSDMKKFIDRCYCFCSFDKADRSAWLSEFEYGRPKYASLIAICEQNNFEDMGFTADALKLSFQSLGFRITGIQKVLHAFKAGEVLSQDPTLEEANRMGLRLMKTLTLLDSKIPVKNTYSR
ncbi:MAG: flavodoxin family protein [Candidatus Brocadiales bacterium]|nr:flavodoxin family protein [Candidatus Brocadiales bacterium]